MAPPPQHLKKLIRELIRELIEASIRKNPLNLKKKRCTLVKSRLAKLLEAGCHHWNEAELRANIDRMLDVHRDKPVFASGKVLPKSADALQSKKASVEEAPSDESDHGWDKDDLDSLYNNPVDNSSSDNISSGNISSGNNFSDNKSIVSSAQGKKKEGEPAVEGPFSEIDEIEPLLLSGMKMLNEVLDKAEPRKEEEEKPEHNNHIEDLDGAKIYPHSAASSEAEGIVTPSSSSNDNFELVGTVTEPEPCKEAELSYTLPSELAAILIKEGLGRKTSTPGHSPVAKNLPKASKWVNIAVHFDNLDSAANRLAELGHSTNFFSICPTSGPTQDSKALQEKLDHEATIKMINLLEHGTKLYTPSPRVKTMVEMYKRDLKSRETNGPSGVEHNAENHLKTMKDKLIDLRSKTLMMPPPPPSWDGTKTSWIPVTAPPESSFREKLDLRRSMASLEKSKETPLGKEHRHPHLNSAATLLPSGYMAKSGEERSQEISNYWAERKTKQKELEASDSPAMQPWTLAHHLAHQKGTGGICGSCPSDMACSWCEQTAVLKEFFEAQIRALEERIKTSEKRAADADTKCETASDNSKGVSSAIEHNPVKGKKSYCPYCYVFMDFPGNCPRCGYERLDESPCTICENPYHSTSSCKREWTKRQHEYYMKHGQECSRFVECDFCKDWGLPIVEAADLHKVSNNGFMSTSKDLEVTYWAKIKSGEDTMEVPIDSSNVSGLEKEIVIKSMPKVWKWVNKSMLGGKIGLAEAYDLAKDMHRDDVEKKKDSQDTYEKKKAECLQSFVDESPIDGWGSDMDFESEGVAKPAPAAWRF